MVTPTGWQDVWISLLTSATQRIDIVGYAYPFVLELMADASDLIAGKCRDGATVRLAFAGPDCSTSRYVMRSSRCRGRYPDASGMR